MWGDPCHMEKWMESILQKFQDAWILLQHHEIAQATPKLYPVWLEFRLRHHFRSVHRWHLHLCQTGQRMAPRQHFDKTNAPNYRPNLQEENQGSGWVLQLFSVGGKRLGGFCNFDRLESRLNKRNFFFIFGIQISSCKKTATAVLNFGCCWHFTSVHVLPQRIAWFPCHSGSLKNKINERLKCEI